MNITKLLLISDVKEDVDFSQAVASTTGLELIHTRSFEQAAKAIQDSDEPMVIFVDVSTQQLYESFENTIQETIGLFSEKVDPNRVHFLSTHSLGKCKYLIQSPIFGHFVMRNYGDPNEAGKHYGNIVRATLQERVFGLEKLMTPGCKIQTVKLVTSTQKLSAVDAVRNYLTAAKFQQRIAIIIANAVDEIIMNSIFDAPVDEAGRPLYSATSRTTVLKLEGKSAVEVQIGFDGKYVGITAIDHYGSLDKTKLLNYISKIYAQEEYKVKTAVAGAGIGLARIFQSGGGSFVFAAENNVRTEVTLLFKTASNYRVFKTNFRFVSTQFYF